MIIAMTTTIKGITPPNLTRSPKATTIASSMANLDANKTTHVANTRRFWNLHLLPQFSGSVDLSDFLLCIDPWTRLYTM